MAQGVSLFNKPMFLRIILIWCDVPRIIPPPAKARAILSGTLRMGNWRKRAKLLLGRAVLDSIALQKMSQVGLLLLAFRRTRRNYIVRLRASRCMPMDDDRLRASLLGVRRQL